MGVSIDTSTGYIRVDGKGVKLTILGQELTGDFSVERATAEDGTAVTAIVAANVSYSIGSATAGATLTNGHGAFLATAAGLAGAAGGTIGITLPGDASFTGTFALAVNTTHAAVDTTLTVGGEDVALKLIAGPYLRIAGTGVKLSLRGPDPERRLRLRVDQDARHRRRARRHRPRGRHGRPARRRREPEPVARRRPRHRQRRHRRPDRPQRRPRRRLRGDDRAQRPERLADRRPARPGQHDDRRRSTRRSSSTAPPSR